MEKELITSRKELDMCTGSHCEVCHFPVPDHEWVVMDEQGFILECDIQKIIERKWGS